MTRRHAPSLRDFLSGITPGKHVIAYLTLGDPAERFIDVADEVLAAGALTLELGFPHRKPLEGKTLLASHHRALAAGADSAQAMSLFAAVAERHPARPLIAVVQGAVVEPSESGNAFLDALAAAGAAAILPVGLPLWQLPALAARIAEREIETVVACPSDASQKFRDIALRYCTGCLYVPRGRVTGTSAGAADVGEFCRAVARESALPMVVGVGVENAEDVAQICATPAKAAAVGSALVEHIVRGGSAGDFIRQLIAAPR